MKAKTHRTKRSKAAAVLGNLGGKRRAERMSAEERSESARRAAQTRWANERNKAKWPESLPISGHATEEMKARHNPKENEGQ